MKSERQKIKHFISIIFCTFLPRKINSIALEEHNNAD